MLQERNSLLQPKDPLVKRLFDIIVSGVLLIILSPLVVIIAALVFIFLGSPIIFRQTRPGFLARPFEIAKFRTMKPATGAALDISQDSLRLTPLGRFLRMASLDELPELWNVLKGDMSLVGPRPLLMQYIPRYSPEQMRRHEMRPGITGWAQVNGRNALPWPARFEMDTWYIDHWSFGLDLKILLLTVVKVFRREGVSEPGQATVHEFMGNDEVNAGENPAKSSTTEG